MIDLYAGSLSRYCSGQWETSGASRMRAMGMPMITTYGAPAGELSEAVAAAQGSTPVPRSVGRSPWVSPEAASEMVMSWLASINAKGYEPAVTLNEAHDQFWTEQFPPRVRDALIVFTSHLHRPDIPMPAALAHAPADYPAYAEASQRGYYMGPIAVFEATLFLPTTWNVIFPSTDPLGRWAGITTTSTLRSRLVELNAHRWQATPDQQNEWMYAAGDSLESAAQVAWARLSVACDYAEANRVAIIVDS
jgi:hypothetical protein